MAGNKWWLHIKATIRSFVADYSKRINRDILAEQTAQESRVGRAIKLGDSGEIVSARAELSSLSDWPWADLRCEG